MYPNQPDRRPNYGRPMSPYLPTGLDANGNLVDLKPTISTYWKTAAAVAVVALPLMVLAIWRGGRHDNAVMNAIMAIVTVVVVAICSLLVLFVTRIRVSLSDLIVRSAVGVTKRLPRFDLWYAVLVVNYRATQVVTAPLLLIVNSRNKVAYRVGGLVWSRDSIERLLAALALPTVHVIPEIITPKALNRRFPGLLRLNERRPGLFGVIVGLGFVVVVILGAVAWVALDD